MHDDDDDDEHRVAYQTTVQRMDSNLKVKPLK